MNTDVVWFFSGLALVFAATASSMEILGVVIVVVIIALADAYL